MDRISGLHFCRSRDNGLRLRALDCLSGSVLPNFSMIKPNQYTLPQPDGMYGLHKFKDGELALVKQHSTGDWQTIRKPTPEEEAYFKKFGTAVAAESRPLELSPDSSLPEM